MALITVDMFGNKQDKVEVAIKRLKTFEPCEGYYVADSGGKDSCIAKALCALAGVKHDSHYSATTVDPPELVRFIREYHKDTEIIKPELSMRKLIIMKQFPPTRFARYCCEYLKEPHGSGRVTVTGVRWAESKNRRNNQGLVTFTDPTKELYRAADSSGVELNRTSKGGVVLNTDNDPNRRMVEMCYRTHKTLINPIIDWSDTEVWEFIKHYNVPYCGLYDEGCKRLGCIGCPLGGFRSQKREFERWPIYKKLYISAFDDMLAARRKSGKTDNYSLWKDGEGVFRWWTGEGQGRDKNQIAFDLQEEQFDVNE